MYVRISELRQSGRLLRRYLPLSAPCLGPTISIAGAPASFRLARDSGAVRSENASIDLPRDEACRVRLLAVQLLRFVVKSQPRRKTRRILRAAAFVVPHGNRSQIRTASASFPGATLVVNSTSPHGQIPSMPRPTGTMSGATVPKRLLEPTVAASAATANGFPRLLTKTPAQLSSGIGGLTSVHVFAG